MNKHFIVLLIGIVSLTFFITSCGTKKSPEKTEGKISTFVGEVVIDGKTAAVDASVPAGSEIKTGSDSFCEVTFNEKNIIHILDNSDITLDISTINKIIKVKSGGVASVLKNLKPSKSDENTLFNVETSAAIASVRGTTFFVKVENESNTYICDCNGFVDISEKNTTNTIRVESSHHKGFRFGINEKGPFYQEAGLLYHNDQSMEEIAGKIGEKIDWTQPDK